MSRQPFPFTSHDSTDEPLYAVADSAYPTPSVPSLEPLIASDRISSRADCLSGFFRALCQRYRPLAPQAVVDDSEAENVTTFVPPAFPVHWTGENEQVDPKDDSLEPLLPKGKRVETPVPKVEQRVPLRSKSPEPLPESLRGGVLQKAIYNPHGKWAWAAGLPFKESEPGVLLASGVMCSAFLKSGFIGDQPVRLISKMWLTKEKWHGFFSELALYKLQLKSLQGNVVPAIINVYSCTGAVDVAMEPPHHSFWIEASADMPHVLKKRCVEAFQKLHAAGVLHGDIELRHMLIGGDARVTVIDFQASRALEPNPAVKLAAATRDELRLEMRKVKFKLDYEDARAREDEKLMRAVRLARRNQRGRTHEEPLPEDVRDPPIDSREWNLDWIGAPVDPTRFIMPGQTAENLERAVEEFLDILEQLEEEEACLNGVTTRRRRASPDFKPPTIVHAKPSGMQPLGKGFGATVVAPSTRRLPRQQKAAQYFKPPMAIAPRTLGKAIEPIVVTPTTLKRKGECDRPEQGHKRVRIDARTTPSTSRSPSPAYEEMPPVGSRPLPATKVRDFSNETRQRRSSTLPRQPQLAPTRAPSPHLDSSPSSFPAKRKRASDAWDESLETRGRPRMRTSLSCDVSQSPCNYTISVVVQGAADVSVRGASDVTPAVVLAPRKTPCNTVHVPQLSNTLFPTPLLSIRFIENIWRLVS